MISPETDASSFTKAAKSIAVMPRAPHRRRHPTYRRSASPATAAAACRPAGVVPRSRAGPCSAGAKAGFMSISGASRAVSPGVAVPLVATLISIYIVSQFLRNSIGVIAPNLAAALALSPAEIGLLSSAFFLVFAAVQIPLGMALDRFGPRLCLMVGAAITVVGTVVFALATSPGVLIFGRALLGLGTAGSLVASLAVYAQRVRPERFATLTGLQVGIGTLGTLMATAPLAVATAAIGWRASFLAVGGFTLMIAVLVAAVVPDDTRPRGRQETLAESLRGILAVLRTPSMGGLTQIAGAMLWGPMDRVAGSHKLPVLLGAGASAAALGTLALVGVLGPSMLVLWFAACGFVTAYVPLLIAHGRALFPLHLVGRGLTVLTMASMGGT